MSKTPLHIRLTAYLVVIVAMLAIAELLLRLLGYQPHQPVITTVFSKPAHALLPHKKYGLALNPGAYQVNLNEHLKYQVKHQSDTSRYCGIDTVKNKPYLNFYGCSFTYGMGVNDLETFPALIQTRQDQFSVKNYGAPGYGTIHALLQLQQHIQTGNIPKLVILGYSSLQDARNQLSGIQQKYWSETLGTALHVDINKARFPFVNNKGKKLRILSKSVNQFDQPWPWSKYSVALYRIETMWSNIYYGFKDKYKLTEMIVEEIQSLCQKYQIDFYVLGLDKSPSLNKMKVFCAAQSIGFIDAGIDIFDPTFNLEPWDAHPNARAHQFYADKIMKHLHSIFSIAKGQTEE